MAWSTPRTWVTGEVVTAAMMNGARDQLVDLDRRTSPVAALVITGEATAATTYGNLTTIGPVVTTVIGSTGKALVSLYSWMASSVVDQQANMGWETSGATTLAVDDNMKLIGTSPTVGLTTQGAATFLQSGLNPGTTTFTAKYRASTGNTATFTNRRITVTPLGS